MESMEYFIFNELIKSKTGSFMERRDIQEQALKQLSRCRFDIKGKECIVKILWKENVKTVIFTNEISIRDFQNQFVGLLGEPSLDFMLNKITDDNKKLLDFLEEYQENYYKLGSEFGNEYWFKLYSTTEIKDDMRVAYHAGWIDYEKQLIRGEVIYDERKLSGLWAAPKGMLFKIFNNECKERYGSKLFVLRPVLDCRYLDDGKEIIGDRYIVVKKYDLDKLNDIGKLCEFLNRIEQEKRNEEIEIIKDQLEDSYMENSGIRYILKQKKRQEPLLLILAILLGIIVGCLIV